MSEDDRIGVGRPFDVPRPQSAFLISHDGGECTECRGCVRHCPARAIRVIDGRAAIIEERCVKCGLCITECSSGGYRARDDLARVRHILASGRPVVAVLASEYIAAMHPMSGTEVERSLVGLGFDSVESTVLGEELVAAAYEQLHARANDSFPRLRSTCPVVVSWVQCFYPALVSALVTVVPPYVAQARLVKAIYPRDTAVVYMSPCWARKDEAFEKGLRGAVDAVIGFDELKTLLAEEPLPNPPAGRVSGHERRERVAKEISLTDGFPRRTLAERDMTSRDVVTVRGMEDIDELLGAIVRGETAPAVVDMLLCEGCIDGPTVNAELSVFAKRNMISAERERQPPPSVTSREMLRALPAVELRRSFLATPALIRVPAAEEIDSVLSAGEFLTRAEVLDCGACGYRTCVAHAAAICLGDSSWEVCFPLQRKRLVREHAELTQRALVDSLTGLGNRRAFDERFAQETARAARHGSQLSLAMVDIDAFKSVNDAHGHPMGDALLCRVGALLRDTLRATDIPMRYGGDEFAVILPATGKTEAWLVAEKLRDALRELAIDVANGASCSVTASIGVASLGASADSAKALLGAADAALYVAKRRGRDRVELAVG